MLDIPFHSLQSPVVHFMFISKHPKRIDAGVSFVMTQKHVLERKKSGAQNRKRKLKREEANQKLAGSLNKFLRNTKGLDGHAIEPVPSTSTPGLKFYNGNISQNVSPSESEEDTVELIET
ncbi:hypothetical protein TNCV_4626831 [Trichonephila clavipes]|nr:hypothetical protein TNCV_4626831 [Trichonephila clavipes]